MGLLDYPQIVKNPMDLATCKEKLLSGRYATYEEVFGDIQLIWDNCKLYNMIGCEIYKICERMEKTAKRQVQKFRAAHGLPQPQTHAPPGGLRKRQSVQPIGRSGVVVTGGRESANADRGRRGPYQEESKQSVAAAGDDYEFGEGGRQSEKVTTDMKMDLVAKVKKLSNEGLTKLVKHVQTVAQLAMTELEDERVQIRVDDFDKETFNGVIEFIEEILLNEQPSKRQKTAHEIETVGY